MYTFDSLGQKIIEIDSAVEKWITTLGLTYNNFAVLYSLASGITTQKQISETWYLPKQTVFTICKEYKDKGWVTFQLSELDKRQKIITLTYEGKKHTEPLYQSTQSVMMRTFARLGQKKSTQLFRLISELCAIYNQEIDAYQARNHP